MTFTERILFLFRKPKKQYLKEYNYQHHGYFHFYLQRRILDAGYTIKIITVVKQDEFVGVNDALLIVEK